VVGVRGDAGLRAGADAAGLAPADQGRGTAQLTTDSPATPTLRFADPGDAPALAAFAAQAFTETYRALDDPQDIADYVGEHLDQASIGRVLRDAACTTLLLESGHAIVGYAVLRHGPPPWFVTGAAPIELWRFYLGAAHIGRGQGTRLLDVAIAHARQSGARTLWLSVYSRNQRAIAFYERAGLRQVGARDFKFGGKMYLDPVYAMALDSGA
jgi:diamine N-acetyltransferase